ncbi:MAG TPA: bifunctional DNA-formamidopyrimidine glycosylase/DNA-(apurinic or apyrimidinic site) lyase [Solirubrobacterales bacterium]|nr:bifunctional DNA-formamidopyrimidine glycosylase/DNA-(apurinic or apyrimidinic site) lyase [Solirubrobacterales bacterium]
MPELPEVETVRRQLEPELVGRRITSAEVLDERLTRPEPPRALERAVEDREVTAVARRGKYLLVGLEGGRTLALHLRMTGNLLLRDPAEGVTADLMKSDPASHESGSAEPRAPSHQPRLYESKPEPSHIRARFELDDGRALLFTDVRRFGQAVVLDAGDQLDDFFASRLGVEPLSGDLTPERLLELAANRKAPLKSFLLSQSRIAGIGNIYADEALWRARLHPLSPAGSMRREHAARLVEGIVGALQAGLDHGGASIDDYLDARGEPGSMQEEFLVHTREGEPCLRPGEEHRPSPAPVIQRIVVTGRSTYFCPNCQERLRRRPRRRKPARRAGRGTGAR